MLRRVQQEEAKNALLQAHHAPTTSSAGETWLLCILRWLVKSKRPGFHIGDPEGGGAKKDDIRIASVALARGSSQAGNGIVWEERYTLATFHVGKEKLMLFLKPPFCCRHEASARSSAPRLHARNAIVFALWILPALWNSRASVADGKCVSFSPPVWLTYSSQQFMFPWHGSSC